MIVSDEVLSVQPIKQWLVRVRLLEFKSHKAIYHLIRIDNVNQDELLVEHEYNYEQDFGGKRLVKELVLEDAHQDKSLKVVHFEANTCGGIF